jgi:hypothetical protein
VRRPGLLALLAAAIAAGTVGAVTPGIPTIYVTYSPNCSFTVSVDGGTTVTATSPPGPTLPPGQYQIQVLMENPTGGYSCGTPVFTLTGPGVSSVTTFPQESILDNHVLPALRPSATYTAQDENAPGATRVFFSTAASGSSTSLISPPASASSASTGSSGQTDIVGSAVLPVRGRLTATVGARGSTKLAFGGRAVSTLQTGRYAVIVTDESSAGGFQLRRSGARPVIVTTAPFRGRKTRTVALRAGHWTYPGGSFVVE